ncbi:MAG: hypothetical protein FIB02_04490 [Desulfuromonas sp.]|nr:hypothetical protein [Desulfuromonas sp.]
MGNYRHIPLDELAPADLRRRRWRLGLARRSRWLFRHETIFNWRLRQGLAMLSSRRHGFAVPSSWGVAACGLELQLLCPPRQIPLQLVDWVGRGEERWHLNDYFLGTGDWLPLARPSDDTSVGREAAELHACSFDYRSTTSYAALLEAIGAGRPVRRQQILLDTPRQIDLYFERFIALFHAIASQGVLPQRRLRELGAAAPGEGDVGVAVTADGGLLRLPGGQHRTAIARLLDLPAMPVEVRLFHAEWLRGVMAQGNRSPIEAIRIGISGLQQATAGR